MTVKIAPSLLSADPLRLWEEALDIKKSGADLLHLDVMDGHFVPNLTFGPSVAKGFTKLGVPLDVHLMVDCIDWAVPAFVQALSGKSSSSRNESGNEVGKVISGESSICHYVTIHGEATHHVHRWIKFIKEWGVRAGVALNPSTDPAFLEYILPDIDLVLIMTVNPGWGGQAFISQMLSKVSRVRQMIDSMGLDIELEVDGGINGETGALARDAGASILVAGNYVFSSQERRKAIESLRG